MIKKNEKEHELDKNEDPTANEGHGLSTLRDEIFNSEVKDCAMFARHFMLTEESRNNQNLLPFSKTVEEIGSSILNDDTVSF